MSDLLPRVSVCLLTYNRARVLPLSLDSLLAQSHGDFELIINDNHSSDGTEEICRDYERRDSRVRYFKNRTNLGFSGNQNAAFLRASSDFVALVHDGDIYREDLIEKWTRALVAYPTAAVVFNSLEAMDQEGRVVKLYSHHYEPLVPGVKLFDEMIRMAGSPIFGIAMVRKHCVLSVGPFDPRMPTIADVDMWFRLLLRYDAAYIGEPLLRVAPREANHPTLPTNWNVRGEHELIYALNSRRRYPGEPQEISRLRREIAPMLRNLRLRALLYCMWHRRLRAVIEGLGFIARKPLFPERDEPDSVLDWSGARRLIDG